MGHHGSASSGKHTNLVLMKKYAAGTGKLNLYANDKNSVPLCYLLCKWSSYIHQHFFSCRDRNDLAEVVALLKTQIDPELLKREEQKQQSKPDGEEDKENTDESKGLTFKLLVNRFTLILVFFYGL